MNIITGEFLIAVAAGMVRSATPVLYATLGEIITERSGILNAGLEGIMLVGAFTGVAITYNTHSIILGLLAATAAGVLLGLFHALLSIQFHANQVGAGIAMTIFGAGLSAYLGMDYVGKQINTLGTCKTANFERFTCGWSNIFFARYFGLSYLFTCAVACFYNQVHSALG